MAHTRQGRTRVFLALGRARVFLAPYEWQALDDELRVGCVGGVHGDRPAAVAAAATVKADVLHTHKLKIVNRLAAGACEKRSVRDEAARKEKRRGSSERRGGTARTGFSLDELACNQPTSLHQRSLVGRFIEHAHTQEHQRARTDLHQSQHEPMHTGGPWKITSGLPLPPTGAGPGTGVAAAIEYGRGEKLMARAKKNVPRFPCAAREKAGACLADHRGAARAIVGGPHSRDSHTHTQHARSFGLRSWLHLLLPSPPTTSSFRCLAHLTSRSLSRLTRFFILLFSRRVLPHARAPATPGSEEPSGS